MVCRFGVGLFSLHVWVCLVQFAGASHRTGAASRAARTFASVDQLANVEVDDTISGGGAKTDVGENSSLLQFESKADVSSYSKEVVEAAREVNTSSVVSTPVANHDHKAAVPALAPEVARDGAVSVDDEVTLLQVPDVMVTTRARTPTASKLPRVEPAKLPSWLRFTVGLFSSLGQPVLFFQAADEYAGHPRELPNQAIALTQVPLSLIQAEDASPTWLLVAVPIALLAVVLLIIMVVLQSTKGHGGRPSESALYTGAKNPLREDWPPSPRAGSPETTHPVPTPLPRTVHAGRPVAKPTFSGDPGRAMGQMPVGMPPPLCQHFILSVGEVSFKMSVQALLTAGAGAQIVDITGLSGVSLFHAHVAHVNDGSRRLELALARDWEAPRAAVDGLTLGARAGRLPAIYDLEGNAYGEIVPPDPAGDGRRFTVRRGGHEFMSLTVQDGPTLIQVKTASGQYLASTSLEGFFEGRSVNFVFVVSPGADSILMVMSQLAVILMSPHAQQVLGAGRI